MGNKEVALVGKLQLVQPQAFICGTLAVPLDMGDHHLFIQDCNSAMTVLHDRSSNPLYKRLPTDTDLNRPMLAESLSPYGPFTDATRKPFRQSIPWGGSYLPKIIAKKGEALAVTGLAQYGDSIDVIAPSAILKEIFKTPYSSSPLSVSIHRVGRTLILNSGLDADKDSRRHGPCDSIDTALFSRFVNHSIQIPPMLDGEKTEKTSGWEVPAKQVEALGEASTSAHPSSSTLPCTSELDHSTVGVPEASKHCNVDEKRFTLKGGVDPQMHMHKGTARQQPPDCRRKGQTAQTGGSANADETEDNSEERFEERKLEGFIRIVFWQFQQLRMLLGTDLLLFSNGHQGAVSLHLMEVEREVSPLQWLDAWLDNVMASVPELAVCYHRGGVVQGYELLKTDDIFLQKGLAGDGSPNFSPGVVQKNASSVLRFLQENCTRDPGTYWLHKGAGDDKMQLFDLGSETGTEMEVGQTLPQAATSSQNCYLLPLAMLLFRLADRLSHSKDMWNLRKCTTFFGHCLSLLNKEEHYVRLLVPKVTRNRSGKGLRAVAHEQVARIFLTWHNKFGSPTKSWLLQATNENEGGKGDDAQTLTLHAPVPSGSPEAAEDSMGSKGAISHPPVAQTVCTETETKQDFTAESCNGLASFGDPMESQYDTPTGPVAEVAGSKETRASSAGRSNWQSGESDGVESALVCVSANEGGGGLELNQSVAEDSSDVAELGISDSAASGGIGSEATASAHVKKDFTPEDAVSARLEAVRHTSEAIQLLRKQRQVLEEAVGAHRVHGTGRRDPDVPALCICGEEGCLPLGSKNGSEELRVKSECRIQGLIALVGDAYLSLALAFKEEGEIGRALRAAELACLVCGSMPLSLRKSGVAQDKDRERSLSDCQPEPFRERKFWGQLWEVVGDIYVEFQRSFAASDIDIGEENSRCQELRISDAVVREVKRLRKKYVKVPTTCSGCSATGCSCLVDRASSGRGASSSAERRETPVAGDGRAGGARNVCTRNQQIQLAMVPVDETGKGGCGSASRSHKATLKPKLSRKNSGKRASGNQRNVAAAVECASVGGERNGNGQSEGNILEAEGRCSSGNAGTDALPVSAAAELESTWEPLDVSETEESLLCFGRPLSADWEVNYGAAAEYYAAAASAFADLAESQTAWEGATRKKGWAQNELGRRFQAGKRMANAELAFGKAQDAFREVKDLTNAVLVDCNLGHGRRSAAEGLVLQLSGLAEGSDSKSNVVRNAMYLYLKALDHYTAARNELLREGESVLKTRGAIWNEVHTQFAHTYLRLGMLMAAEEVQRSQVGTYVPLAQTEQSKGKGRVQVDLTAMEALTKALILYESLGPSRTQEAAYAHLQLACLTRDKSLNEVQRLLGGRKRMDRGSHRTNRGTAIDGESGRTHGVWAVARKYAALAEIHWQKALEVYKPEAHPDVYATIIVDRTDLNLAARSHQRSNQLMGAAVSNILNGVLVWKVAWEIERRGVAAGGTESRVKTPSQASVDKMVGRLQDVLKDMLVAAMSVNANEIETGKVPIFKLEMLRCMYKAALGGSNSRSLVKMQEIWTALL